MVKFKTNIEKELFDRRLKSIGSHIVRLIVNDISANNGGVTANGFYYYEVEGQQMVLDPFKTDIPWEQVELAETQLPTFDNHSLRSAFIQRIIEFSFIQQEIESGDNYSTVRDDWELDEEFESSRKN